MPPRLRIAQVAPLFAPVPPLTYGGTERIVYHLTEELVARGHDVTLYATGDSRTSARLRAIRECSLFESYAKEEFWRSEFCHAAAIAAALRDAAQFDLIHFHLGTFSAPFSAVCPIPSVHSVPSPLEDDDQWVLERFPDAVMTVRSRNQMAGVPPARRGNMHVIYNGCDFDQFAPPEGPGRYLAFLGRMAEDKNPLDAIRIAERAGMPIVLAGEPWDEDDHEYFEEQVRPLLDGRQAAWIGAVDDRQKSEFLRDAAAFLFPIQWEEPFGIVMIEAMACGAPVLAYQRGSVAEVVEPGITGYYADSAEELAALVPRALELNRAGVRGRARERFSRAVMADGYLEVYNSIMDR